MDSLPSNSLRAEFRIEISTSKSNSERSSSPSSPTSPIHQSSSDSISRLCPNSQVRTTTASTKSAGNSHSMHHQPISQSHFSMRSATGMQGLLLAEIGGGLVELDPLGGTSGSKQGTSFIPELVTPRGGTFDAGLPPDILRGNTKPRGCSGARNEQRLSRHATLLTQGATPARNAAELKSLLGNSRSKIKSGAELLPPPTTSSHGPSIYTDTAPVALEQGKSRARVEVDILLDSEVCVEGGYLTGKLHVEIRKGKAKEASVLLGGGKMRVVGFEGIPDGGDRHTFYQHAAPLTAVSASSHVLYSSSPDKDGFSRAREGRHTVPFAMKLPLSDGDHVGVKGVFDNRSGVVIKYIVIASFKLKDPATSKRSIAHFYRSCELYPFLNPSTALAPALHPLLSTAARSLFLGGTGKLKLTASLHRDIWVAGQKCCVSLTVHNESKKTVRALTLSLIRTTTVFRPHPHLDVASPNFADPDACQTTTMRKLVAEATLEAGQCGLRGHVTGKGWWTGVEAGERTDFAHFILLPPDALSIVRSRLLEVQYAIRVSLVAGSLSSEVSVTLPIRIINHLSIDPPPIYPISFDRPGISAPVPALPILSIDPGQTVSAQRALPRYPTIHGVRDVTTRDIGSRLISVFDDPHGNEVVRPSGKAPIPDGSSGEPLPRMPFVMPRLDEEDMELDVPTNSGPSRSCSDYSQDAFEERDDLRYSHGNGVDEDFSDESVEMDRTDELEGTRGLVDNLDASGSDNQVDCAVGLVRLNQHDEHISTGLASLNTIMDEPEPLTFPLASMQFTSSQSSCSSPSAEGSVSTEPFKHQAPCGGLGRIKSSRPKSPEVSRYPPPIPEGSRQPPYFGYPVMSRPQSNPHVLESLRARASGFPFPSQVSEKKSRASHEMTKFSQRVVDTCRSGAIKPPVTMTSRSDGDGTRAEGTGGQKETSSSEVSLSPSPSHPNAGLATLESPTPRRLPEPPSKVPTLARPVMASYFSGSVRSRIAELEGLCGGAPTKSSSIGKPPCSKSTGKPSGRSRLSSAVLTMGRTEDMAI